MLKKINKYFLFSICVFLGIFCVKFNAEALTDSIINGDVVWGQYYYTHHRGTEYFWDSVRYIERLSDGAKLYCIQPLVHIQNDAVYDVYTDNYAAHANLDDATWKRIERIAYYGYSYFKDGIDHSDVKWYAAAQMLIWRAAAPDVDAYFTRTIRGERDDSILRDEMDEINWLVDNHEQVPDFVDFPTSMYIGDKLSVQDNSNMLSKFTVKNVTGGKVEKSGDVLNLSSTYGNNIKFSLVREHGEYRAPVKLYYSSNSQMAIYRGSLETIKKDYQIPVKRGRIKISKKDEYTGADPISPEATLEGAVYGIYNMDGSKVLELETGSAGDVSSGDLSRLGDFYVQEITPSKGYLLDERKYKVTISKDDLYPSLTVYERPIMGFVKLVKLFEDEKGVLQPEKNVSFELYFKANNQKYRTVVTDENGEITLDLPYGTYIVHQVNTLHGYEKVDDFEIVIDGKSDEIIVKQMINRPIKAKVKVLKKNSETGEIIRQAGFKFKIRKVDTGEYICENNTCIYETNLAGEFLTTAELLSGSYELIEISSIYGYVLNKNAHKFEICEHSNFIVDEGLGKYIELEFFNEPVKGQILLKKIGEELKIEEGAYKYNEVPLKDTLFSIYALEDIISNGKILYKKGELVESLLTDENGEAISKLLPLGKYYLKEIRTSGGNLISDIIYEVVLNFLDENTPIVFKNVTVKNFLPKGKLEFVKRDYDDDKVLAGALIEIYNEFNVLVFSEKTDKEGKICISDLPIGKYYLLEKSAPQGYVLSDEKMFFEVKSNGEILSLEMKNKKEIDEDFIISDIENNNMLVKKDELLNKYEVEVPDTISLKNWSNEIVGVIFLLVGVLLKRKMINEK